MIHAFLIAVPTFFAPGSAPAVPVSDAAPASTKESKVTTPIFPNASCPIMGKPISTRLFTDTEMGRIYICCKSCVKDIQADVPTAYRTAYPTDTKIENKVCPVTGAPITKESPSVVLQGFEFFVKSAKEIPDARTDAQIVLARVHDPKLVDLENQTCPVADKPVARNTFVVIEGTIVRLSSAKLLDEIEKDPVKVLKRAREIRERESKAAPAKEAPKDAK